MQSEGLKYYLVGRKISNQNEQEYLTSCPFTPMKRSHQRSLDLSLVVIKSIGKTIGHICEINITQCV